MHQIYVKFCLFLSQFDNFLQFDLFSDMFLSQASLLQFKIQVTTAVSFILLLLTFMFVTGSNFKAALINQEHHPPDLDAIFTYIEPPDLNEMFKVKRPRFNKRTSSAVWHSPLHKPL